MPSHINDYIRVRNDDQKAYRNAFAKNRNADYEYQLTTLKLDQDRKQLERYFKTEQKQLQRRLGDLHGRRSEIRHGSSRDTSPVMSGSHGHVSRRNSRSPSYTDATESLVMTRAGEGQGRGNGRSHSSLTNRSRSPSISRDHDGHPAWPQATHSRSCSQSTDISDPYMPSTLSPTLTDHSLSSSLNENMFRWYKVWDTSSHGRQQRDSPVKTRSTSWNNLSRDSGTGTRRTSMSGVSQVASGCAVTASRTFNYRNNAEFAPEPQSIPSIIVTDSPSNIINDCHEDNGQHHRAKSPSGLASRDHIPGFIHKTSRQRPVSASACLERRNAPHHDWGSTYNVR